MIGINELLLVTINLQIFKTCLTPLGQLPLTCNKEVQSGFALDKLGNKAALSLRQDTEIRLILCPAIANSETHSLSLQKVGLFKREYPIL